MSTNKKLSADSVGDLWRNQLFMVQQNKAKMRNNLVICHMRAVATVILYLQHHVFSSKAFSNVKRPINRGGVGEKKKIASVLESAIMCFV